MRVLGLAARSAARSAARQRRLLLGGRAFRSGRNLATSAATALQTLRPDLAAMGVAAYFLAGLLARLAWLLVTTMRSCGPAAAATSTVFRFASPASGAARQNAGQTLGLGLQPERPRSAARPHGTHGDAAPARRRRALRPGTASSAPENL